MSSLLVELLAQRPVLLDGAWGTQLQLRGLPVGACPELWNLDHPDRVEAVARAYVEAGSRIVLTNTFGGNRYTLAQHGLADRVAEVNRAGAAISKRAAGSRAAVFGSIGPTGKMLLMGEVTEEELAETFLEQALALQDGGADGIVLETFADLAEAQAGLRAAREAGLPVAVSFAYLYGERQDRTMMGVTPAEQVAGLPEADILGANCGPGVEPYLEVCRQLRAATSKPLWIKPNAGLPRLVDGQAVYDMQPGPFAAQAIRLREAGADFIGGCCGTTPDFIRALRQLLTVGGGQ